MQVRARIPARNHMVSVSQTLATYMILLIRPVSQLTDLYFYTTAESVGSPTSIIYL
jgi:hypothetical protein